MKFSIGDRVEKTGGDYYFEGKVVAAFQKLSGAERYVVENPAGILHVYSEKNLRLWTPKINKIVDGMGYIDEICVGKILTKEQAKTLTSDLFPLKDDEILFTAPMSAGDNWIRCPGIFKMKKEKELKYNNQRQEWAKDILDNWMNPTLKEPRKPVINEDSDDCY